MNILNIILIVLLSYILIQFYMCKNNFENMENKNEKEKKNEDEDDSSYSEYEKENKNAYYLALKNASNISYLKEQLDGVKQIKKNMEELSLNVKRNTSNLTEIAKQISEASNKLVGK